MTHIENHETNGTNFLFFHLCALSYDTKRSCEAVIISRLVSLPTAPTILGDSLQGRLLLLVVGGLEGRDFLLVEGEFIYCVSFLDKKYLSWSFGSWTGNCIIRYLNGGIFTPIL